MRNLILSIFIFCLVLCVGCGKGSDIKYGSKCPKCGFVSSFWGHSLQYDAEEDELQLICFDCGYKWVVLTQQEE